MNKSTHIRGFTLIELIVVISIISIVLIFSFPLFRNINILGDSGGSSGDLVRLTGDLKKRAARFQQDYLLNMDRASGRLWVTHEHMTPEELSAAEEEAVLLSGDIELVSIQFAGMKKELPDIIRIRFLKQGYSDYALLQLREKGDNFTLKIEPFLSQTHILDGHIDFEECI